MAVLDNTSKITITFGETSVSFIPQTYSLHISGVDFDTGRVANGDMERNQVAEKRSCKIGLPPMRTADLKLILNIISGVEHAQVTATIVDPSQADGYYTGLFYCGDRDCPSYNWALDLWESTTFDLIEY